MKYIHTMTVITPTKFIDVANHLALLIGESIFDITTFEESNWLDTEGNTYSIVSTAIKPVVISVMGKEVTVDDIPLHAKEILDIDKANQALGLILLYKEGDKISNENITIIIDYEPLATLESLGITSI